MQAKKCPTIFDGGTTFGPVYPSDQLPELFTFRLNWVLDWLNAALAAKESGDVDIQLVELDGPEVWSGRNRFGGG